MLKNIRKYILDNDFSLNMWANYINVNNFIDILILEDYKVVLKLSNNFLIIKGKNISISKLLNNEILLKGEFSSIELGEKYV